MKTNINGMKCVCGKDLQFHNANHAMCVACGLVILHFYYDRCHAQTNVIENGKN